MCKPAIRGVIPPVLTPFGENGEVDYDKHVRNLRRWNEAPLAGCVVLGSNSEAIFLDEDEKLRLVEVSAEHIDPSRLLIVGTGLESTRATVRFTNQVARLGARAALVLTPFYYSPHMTEEALSRFFTEVADQARVPILIYNVPKFTRLNVSPDLVGRLSRHPNILGMKDSLGDIDQLSRFRACAAEDFNVMVGAASVWCPALALGIEAGILALANVAPQECAEVQRLYRAGRRAEAEALHVRLLPVNAAVTATFGVAGLKYAAELRGYEAGWVRAPLLPLKPEERARVSAVMKQAGLV
jgi:4-hydroxy-2-oxoglutarate aldolase